MKEISDVKNSDIEKDFEHQVFLSFRGPDTRTFVGHLFNALKNKGYRVFMDNDGLEHGKNIQLDLYKAIKRSEMSVVILSCGYADSRWCLDELVKIMELHSLADHSVLPVFFDIEPTEVRYQTGVYEKPFQVMEERYASEMDRVEQWRSALGKIAALRGLLLSADRDEPQLVEDVIEKVRNIVNSHKLYVPPYIVGRQFDIQEINKWLRDGSNDVEVGLIYGLGGIGKSTLAKIVYNQNVSGFDACSFLEDFTRKTAQPDGLAVLLEQLIFDVTGKQGNKIHNVDRAMNAVRAILYCRRVLVVLDDIDELKYLPDAFDDPSFFGKGSKIIITSRNGELRKVSLFKRNFRIRNLDHRESKELLKQQALVTNKGLSQHEEELLDGFLKHCHGIPLAFRVMGPILRHEKEEKWESILEELEGSPNNKIFDVLRMSFEFINDKHTKDLFLYIACFFVGIDKVYTVKILEGCKLRPVSGLTDLINRSLLEIAGNGVIVMHQSIEEMGKEVACQEATDEPGKRSKLWSSIDSLSVLKNNEGSAFIRGLSLLHYNPLNLISIRTSAFTMMKNLNLLRLGHVQLDGSFADFPKKIKWLLWSGCQLSCIPSNFELDELVVLDMQWSSFVHIWEGFKYMGALKILDLSYSASLVCTPDFSSALMLERLFLKGCVSLVDVCESIGNLRYLMHLDVEGCGSLIRIHDSIGNLKKLTVLNLKGCKSLVRFHIPSSAVELDLDDCSGLFTSENQLESLVASSFISSTFNIHLPFLKYLHLANCGISDDQVLERLSSATCLQYLNLGNNPICVLNNDMCAFPSLTNLQLENCTELQSISQLPSRLLVLNVSYCSLLKRVSHMDAKKPTPLKICAIGCDELVEIKYLYHDTQVIECTRSMTGGQAAYLGFLDLNTFNFESNLKFDCRLFFELGVYRAGIYQVYLPGDHLAKWFTATTTVEELFYTVPSDLMPIRALNLGFVISVHFGVDFPGVIIDNLTSKWKWMVDLGLFGQSINSSSESMMTWLSNWCVMEHREIKPGDLLKICLYDKYPNISPKWGVTILYEDEQQIGTNKTERNGNDAGNSKNEGGSCSSHTNIRNPNKKKMISSKNENTANQEADNSEVGNEDDSSAAAAVILYNKALRSPLLDLSMFQCDLMNGERMYHVGKIVYL